MIFGLRTTLIAAMLAFSFGATSTWWLTAEYKDNKWEAALSKQKGEAATTLQTATVAANTVERKNRDLADTLEINHVNAAKKQDDLLADNRRLARELGGLRDPGRRPSGRCTVPAPTGSTGKPADQAPGAELSTEGEGVLSPEASAFIIELAAEADRSAQYAGLCHMWVTELSKGKRH